jgi:hypothetical protein
MQTGRDGPALPPQHQPTHRVSVICAGCHVQATADLLSVLRAMGWQFGEAGAVCPRCAKGLPNPFAAT